MTLYDFKQMTDDEQAAIVWELGQYINDRIEVNNNICYTRLMTSLLKSGTIHIRLELFQLERFRQGKFLDAYFRLN
jgi:hypothetical protein